MATISQVTVGGWITKNVVLSRVLIEGLKQNQPIFSKGVEL